MRGAAPPNRAFHATAVVTPPCGSELAALVAAAVAPARDVGDGAVLVTFGGCSPGGIGFGGHDLEVPLLLPHPLLCLYSWGPICKHGCPVVACQEVKCTLLGCMCRGVSPGRMAMLRLACMTFRVIASKTIMELCPCSSHATQCPIA